MNWIESIKYKHSLKKFTKKASKIRFPHDFVDIDNAKKIGFIINMNQFTSKDLITLTDYITKLEEHGKKVMLIELNFKRKTESIFSDTVDSVFINPEIINWLGFPSIEILQKLNSKHCDILVNLDSSEKMTSKFICGLSNAKTRVGLFNEEFSDYYEIMFDLSPETTLKNMLIQIETYLKMIEK